MTPQPYRYLISALVLKIERRGAFTYPPATINDMASPSIHFFSLSKKPFSLEAFIIASKTQLYELDICLC